MEWILTVLSNEQVGPFEIVQNKPTRMKLLKDFWLSNPNDHMLRNIFQDERVLSQLVEMFREYPDVQLDMELIWMNVVWCAPSLRNLGGLLRETNRWASVKPWLQLISHPYISGELNVEAWQALTCLHNLNLILDRDDTNTQVPNPYNIEPLDPTSLHLDKTKSNWQKKLWQLRYSPHFRLIQSKPCQLLDSFREVQHYNAISSLRECIEMETNSSNIAKFPPVFLSVTLCDESQWWDNPTDPCNITHAWPNGVPLSNRCNAICMNNPGGFSRRQCPRFAKPDRIFCLFHTSKVTYHLPNPMKRSVDATPAEYQAHEDASLTRYPLTKRVASGMSFASNPNRPPPSGYYLPVLRYEKLYYRDNPDNKDYCGKFFFYEPHSHLYLHLGKLRVYATKVQAYVTLMKEAHLSMPSSEEYVEKCTQDFPHIDLNYMSGIGDSEELCYTIFSSPNLNQAYDDQCPTLYTTDTANKFIFARYHSMLGSASDVPDWRLTLMPVLFPTDNPKDITPETGEFDMLDQPICEMGKNRPRSQRIDTFLFQHEIGGRDCVTEILDTRPDYNQHLYEMTDIVNPRPPDMQSPYPKIWFPQDNGIVYVGSNTKFKTIEYDLVRIFGQRTFKYPDWDVCQ